MAHKLTHVSTNGYVSTRTTEHNYTHVCVDPDGHVVTWHKTLAAAQKAAKGGRRVEAVTPVSTEPAPQAPQGATLTAEREAAQAQAPEAPKAQELKVEATDGTALVSLVELLPEGATLEAAPSGRSMRILVNGKSIGSVSPRRGGFRLRILTSRLVDAPEVLLEGTKQRASGTTVITITLGNAAKGVLLLEEAARSVA